MAVAAGSLVLSACGGNHVDQLKDGKTAGGHKVSQDTASPSVSPTGGSKVESAKAKALAAYKSYWRVRNTALSHPDPKDTSADKYTIDKAAGELFGTIVQMDKQGLAYRGDVESAPKVTSVAMNKPPKDPSRVQIQDCLDISHLKVYHSSTHKAVNAQNKYKQYRAEAVVRSVGTDWRVSTMDFDLDTPC